jgi:hypothetical protein
MKFRKVLSDNIYQLIFLLYRQTMSRHTHGKKLYTAY